MGMTVRTNIASLKAAGELNHILPGDAARPTAALGRPLNGLQPVDGQPQRLRIAVDDRDISVLIDCVKAETEAEAIRQRHLVIDHIARIDRIILLGQVARHDVTAIRRNVKSHIGRTRRCAALQQRPQGAGVASALLVKTQIIKSSQRQKIRQT